MTKQASDFVHYEDAEYSILGWEGSDLFHPQQLGITTIEMNTACYRGFVNTYEIREGQLLLHSLWIRSDTGQYPLINNTPPSFPNGYKKFGKSVAKYDDIGLQIKATGTLRFGKGLDYAKYGSEWFLSDWMYGCVKQAVITDGVVESVIDISDEMIQIRKQKLISDN